MTFPHFILPKLGSVPSMNCWKSTRSSEFIHRNDVSAFHPVSTGLSSVDELLKIDEIVRIHRQKWRFPIHLVSVGFSCVDELLKIDEIARIHRRKWRFRICSCLNWIQLRRWLVLIPLRRNFLDTVAEIMDCKGVIFELKETCERMRSDGMER